MFKSPLQNVQISNCFIGKRSKIALEFIGKRSKMVSEIIGKRSKMVSKFIGKRSFLNKNAYICTYKTLIRTPRDCFYRVKP